MAHWSVKKQVDGSQVVFELCCSEYDGGAMTVRGELGRLRKNRSAVTEADRRRFWSRALDVMHGLVGEIGFEEAQRLCVRLARREPIPPAPLWSHVSPHRADPCARKERRSNREM